jgi:hypothetical protein
MATSRVKTSSILQGFPKSRSLLAGNSAYIPPVSTLDYLLIAGGGGGGGGNAGMGGGGAGGHIYQTGITSLFTATNYAVTIGAGGTSPGGTGGTTIFDGALSSTGSGGGTPGGPQQGRYTPGNPGSTGSSAVAATGTTSLTPLSPSASTLVSGSSKSPY